MTLKITAANNGQLFGPMLLEGNGYMGPLVNSGSHQVLDSISWRRVAMSVDVAQAQVGETGFHLYNEKDSVYENVTGESKNFDPLTQRGLKEHWHYAHCPRGTNIYRNCKSILAGGQAYQEVDRDIERDSPYDGSFSELLMYGFQALQCGLPKGSRASFAMTFAPHQQGDGQSPKLRWNRGVTLYDPVIEHITSDYQLKGALLAQHRPFLRVFGGRTVYRSPFGMDRALWLCPDTDEIVIERHHFESSGKYIDLDRIKSLRLRGCTGNVIFRINKVKIQPVNQDFDWSV